MRILASPDHEQLAFDVAAARAFERVIRHVCTDAALVAFDLVDVRRVETHGRADVGAEAVTEIQMPADAQSRRAEAARAVRVRLHEFTQRREVGVVRGERFVLLAEVPAIRARAVVADHGARRLILVENLRHCDEEAVTCEHRSRAADGAGDLEDFREERDGGIFSRSRGTEDMRAHRPAGRGDVGKFVVNDGHVRRG